jgi:site-specific recombinase XerD
MSVAELPAGLTPAQLGQQAHAHTLPARAPRTVAAYASDWRLFSIWCAERDVLQLPASVATVASFVADQAGRGLKPASIDRRLVAINRAHKVAGFAPPGLDPRVREVLAGVRRTHGIAQRQVAAVLTHDLKSMLGAAPDSLRGSRNRAILLLGFAGALRRGELVALNVGDLDFQGNGLVVTLRTARTDLKARGRRVGIPFGSSVETCPVRAVECWLVAAAITRGAVFRAVDRHDNVSRKRLSDRSIARLVKEHAELIGLDPAHYAGHSLRAGLATSATNGGASHRAIMRQTGNRSTGMGNRYVREARLFRDNAALLAGL